jgi:hypothetical protein
VTHFQLTILSLSAISLWAGTCLAADPVVPESLRACAAITVDVERYACYDREMARLVPGAAGATAAAAAATTAPPLTAEQRFGLSPGQEVAQTAKAEPLQTLEAKVTAVSEISNGRIVINLDNGQVWRQVDTDVSITLHPGDAVSIKRNTLGSYWLSSGKRALRVKRLK